MEDLNEENICFSDERPLTPCFVQCFKGYPFVVFDLFNRFRITTKDFSGCSDDELSVEAFL
jgi:hypothetical protein